MDTIIFALEAVFPIINIDFSWVLSKKAKIS